MPKEGQSGWSFAFHDLPYDFIARILPGVFALAVWLYTYICARRWIAVRHEDLTRLVTASGGVTATIAFSALAIAWVIGILLLPIGSLLWRGRRSRHVFAKVADQYRDVFQRAIAEKIITHRCSECDSVGSPMKFCKRMERQAYHQIHEHLKACSDEVSGTVAKLQAESTFYQNAVAAVILIFLGNLASEPLWYGHWSWLWFFSMLPLLVVGGVAYYGWFEKVQTIWLRQFAMLAMSLKNAERSQTRPS